MRLVRSFDFRDAFADKGVRNDELRFPVVALFRDVERIEKLLHVVAIDFLDVEAICFEALRGVFALSFFRRGVESNSIRIVDQNQVIEAPMTSERARLRCNPLLHVAVAAQTDDMTVKNCVLARVKTRRCHFRGRGNADGIADALTEWSCSAFHSGSVAKFRMSRRFRM